MNMNLTSTDSQFTRRNFIKSGSALLAASAAPALLAKTSGDAGAPAALGGAKAHAQSWPSWPQWDPQNDAAVAKVLHGRVWSRDKLVKEFEEKWAALMGAKHCLAVVSARPTPSAPVC
ncbi:MAG: DegT/DnrJ/EryC1/StrS family aminotransferase [Verrucomicrobia bacterium]|nr:DegT/DnrJ/EryC1/StrS family aminotransferase [Verrucomicrobiota bacterium]